MLKIIGKIVNTKGLKGEVKVLSSSDFKEVRFKIGNKLLIDYNGNNIEVIVEKWSTHKGIDILKFKEFSNINEVEKFKNKDLLAEKIENDNLKEGEFLFEDLINLDVFEGGKKIGKVIDVFDMVGKTYFKIKKENNEVKLIPYIDEFIVNIILKDSIEIKSIPGLIDD